jgi:D-glucuronyl C5-epimerase C-terminus
MAHLRSGAEMQKQSKAVASSVLCLIVALALVPATSAGGAFAATSASSPRCNISIRTLRGTFSGSVTRTVGASCSFARHAAETSLRAVVQEGGAGTGNFSAWVQPRGTQRRFRVRCAATGDLYSRLGITARCRAGTGGGGTAVRVVYRAGAKLALARRYLDYAQEQLGSYVIGPEGVPWVNVYGYWVEHPDLVAQWGLREYAYGHRRPLMIAARWLADHERADGGIPYLFTLQDGGGVAEFAPWISALSQGQAISELMRAYQLSGSPRYLRAARHALDPFLHPVPTGVTSLWGGHPWYEEYPAAQPQCFHVLNGFMFALVGLHDLAPRSPAAWRQWRAGVRSLVAHVQAFDDPDSNSQFYTALGPDHVPVDAYYAQTDAMLIRAIARWTHNGRLRAYARRWAAYGHINPLSRHKKSDVP